MTPYYADEWATLYLGDCLEVTEWLAADYEPHPTLLTSEATA